jgi:hypothetical protein
MTDSIKLLLEFLKLAPRYLFAVAAVCGILLFSNPEFLQYFSVSEFAKNNRQWFSIAFFSSTVVFLIDRSIEIYRICWNIRLTAKAKKRCLKRLNSLTEEEKQILRFYIAKQTRTNYLRMGDGVVHGLESCGIIRQAHIQGDILEGFAYNITEFAWEYLQKHHATVLNGTTRHYRNDKLAANNRY